MSKFGGAFTIHRPPGQVLLAFCGSKLDDPGCFFFFFFSFFFNLIYIYIYIIEAKESRFNVTR